MEMPFRNPRRCCGSGDSMMNRQPQMKRMITPLRNRNVRRLPIYSWGRSWPFAASRRDFMRQVKITDPNPCMTRWYRLAVSTSIVLASVFGTFTADAQTPVGLWTFHGLYR